jgi:hypothetical protein
MSEFLDEYKGVLQGLVRNDKAQINMLSMLAEDNKPLAEGIVRHIEQHILMVSSRRKEERYQHTARII